ncbi:MAG: hypothetical protein M3237_05335 [Actinomycetota bacterium]|nr:hypothetical protein [Actinomycetota bacterium]
MTLGRAIGLGIAGLLVLIGGVWTFQGLGYIEGSPMTDSETWAIIGPLVAGLGVALGIVVVQKGHE